jgi:tRNA-intron endonuclease, archaea type
MSEYEPKSEAATTEILDQKGSPTKDQIELQQVIPARYSPKIERVVLENPADAQLLQTKGFGSKKLEGETNDTEYFLYDYEVLYLLYTKKMTLSKGKKNVDFKSYAVFASNRDENAWTRFLIFRDLRTRGYIVREGFGFPIDFRVYERGDYGTKAAKYIVFGLVEGKTIQIRELKKNIEDMARMGKEAVVAVVERRGEVIYYKVGKWYPIKPL